MSEKTSKQYTCVSLAEIDAVHINEPSYRSEAGPQYVDSFGTCRLGHERRIPTYTLEAEFSRAIPYVAESAGQAARCCGLRGLVVVFSQASPGPLAQVFRVSVGLYGPVVAEEVTP